MTPLLLRILNIKQEEMPKFSLLFFHSFFLGLVISFHFVPANAVFIKHFGGEYLPLAYLVSGIVGYLTTQAYSILQRRVPPGTLFLTALIFLFVISIVQRVGLWFFDEKWVSFFVFIWISPIYTLIGIESGGIALSLLDIRQMKRMLGVINIGGISASALGYLIIPMVINYIGHTYNLLWISAAGAAASFVFLLIILKRFPKLKSKQSNTDKQVKKIDSSFKDLLKNRYFVLIFGASALSTFVIYFNDFSYLTAIKIQPLLDSPAKVSNFIALVSFTFKTGELVFSYLTNRILSRRGMGLGLTVLPVVSTTIMIFAAVSGMMVANGSTALIFFTLIVMNKIFDRTIRKSIDEISFNILYQPLPAKQKLEVQTKVGVVVQATGGVAGVVLYLMSKFLADGDSVRLNVFALFYVPLLIWWLVTAIALYKEYKARLRQLLTEQSKDKKRDIYKSSYGSEILTKKFKKFNAEVVNTSVTILSETNPVVLEPYAANFIGIVNPICTKAVLRNVDPTWRTRLSKNIEHFLQQDPECGPEIKKLAERAISTLDYDSVKSVSADEFERLKDATSIDDRLKLTKLLVKKRMPDDDSLVLRLLEDKDFRIKRAAIKLAARRDYDKLKHKLLELLQGHEHHHLVGSSLLEIGEKVLPSLDELFHNTDTTVRLRIIEICAKMGIAASKDLLVKYIDFPNKDVQNAVIRGLYFCKFEVTEEQRPAVKQKLDDLVSTIVWIYSCLNDIESEKNTLKLFQSLDLELEYNFEQMFKVLSFLYQQRIVNLIKKNIQGENIIFALEIVDNFINKEDKQLIIPLLDNLSTGQRIKKLSKFFPQKSMGFSDRLKDIVTRDFDDVDVWSVAKAIEILGKLHKKKRTDEKRFSRKLSKQELEVWEREKVLEIMEMIRKSEMPDEIFVCLYHPDELIYSTAAKVVYDENPTRCVDYLEKLSDTRRALVSVLEKERGNSLVLLQERVRLLKRHPLFFSVPQNLLVKLAKLISVITLKPEETIYLVHEDKSQDIFIVIKGQLVYRKGSDHEQFFNQDEILIKGLNIEQDAEFVVAEERTQVLQINRFAYFNVLIEETELIQHIFEEIQTTRDEL